MSNVESIKSSLLRAPWREYKRVTVDGLDGPVELIIRTPPPSALQKLFRTAREEGLLAQDTQSEGDQMDPERAAAAMRFNARIVATTVFLPNAVLSLFTEEEAIEWPRLHEVLPDCMAAISPAKGLEDAKGN